jgi:hypothetical protein
LVLAAEEEALSPALREQIDIYRSVMYRALDILHINMRSVKRD